MQEARRGAKATTAGLLHHASATGEQPAKDANDTADKQEPDGEQQQRLADNGLADIAHEGDHLSSDSTQIRKQRGHSVGGSRENIILSLKYSGVTPWRVTGRRCRQHRR